MNMETASLVLSSIAASFVFLIVLLQLYSLIRPRFLSTVTCWFCGEKSKVAYTDRNAWDCVKCEQYNGFDSDGGYNKVIPAQHDIRLNSLCAVARPPTSSHRTNGLCASCNVNQTLKVQQLAAFVPFKTSRFDDEVDEFSRHLDRVYALCYECQVTLTRELNKQSDWLTGLKVGAMRGKQWAQTQRASLPGLTAFVAKTCRISTVSISAALFVSALPPTLARRIPPEVTGLLTAVTPEFRLLLVGVGCLVQLGGFVGRWGRRDLVVTALWMAANAIQWARHLEVGLRFEHWDFVVMSSLTGCLLGSTFAASVRPGTRPLVRKPARQSGAPAVARSVSGQSGIRRSQSKASLVSQSHSDSRRTTTAEDISHLLHGTSGNVSLPIGRSGLEETANRPMRTHHGLGQPMGAEHGLGQPMGGEHGLGQPMRTHHGLGQPMGGEHGLGQPMRTHHGLGQPMGGEHGLGQPMGAEHGLGRPMGGEHGLGQPMRGEHGLGQPMRGEHGLGQPMGAEHGLGQPMGGEHGLGRPMGGEHGLGRPMRSQEGLDSGIGRLNIGGDLTRRCLLEPSRFFARNVLRDADPFCARSRSSSQSSGFASQCSHHDESNPFYRPAPRQHNLTNVDFSPIGHGSAGKGASSLFGAAVSAGAFSDDFAPKPTDFRRAFPCRDVFDSSRFDSSAASSQDGDEDFAEKSSGDGFAEVRSRSDEFGPIDGKFRPIDGKFRPIDGKFRPIDGKFRPIDGKFRPIDEDVGPKSTFSHRAACRNSSDSDSSFGDRSNPNEMALVCASRSRDDASIRSTGCRPVYMPPGSSPGFPPGFPPGFVVNHCCHHSGKWATASIVLGVLVNLVMFASNSGIWPKIFEAFR